MRTRRRGSSARGIFARTLSNRNAAGVTRDGRWRGQVILQLTVSPTGDVTAITRLRIIPPFTDLVTGAVSPTRGPAPFVLHLLAGNRAVWHRHDATRR